MFLIKMLASIISNVLSCKKYIEEKHFKKDFLLLLSIFDKSEIW